MARFYYVKGMPKVDLHCCIYQGSIAVRIVIVRRQEDRGKLGSCSYLSQYDALQRNDRHRKRIKSRVADRGFRLQTGRAVKAFSYDRATCRNARYNCRTAACCAGSQEQYLTDRKIESIWWRCKRWWWRKAWPGHLHRSS